MKKLFKIVLAISALVILLAASPLVAGAESDVPTHTVTFYDRGDVLVQMQAEEGMPLTEIPTPYREGYKHIGWRISGVDGDMFEPTAPITSDLDLYAVYELLPPTFEISSLSFTYDKAAHTLAFSSVSHPLLEGGILSYEWYRDGKPLGAYGSSLSIERVSDSGVYSCRLVFSVGGDVAEVTTPDIEVTVSKCEVALPNVQPLYYTGDPLSPPIYDTGYYTVDRAPHTAAGTYPVALTLTDPDNYTFIGTEKPSVTVDMTVLPAENCWIVEPSVSDVYTSFSPVASGMARFGTVRFLYSRDGVSYTDEPPLLPGEYYMRAEVEGSENYSSLTSAPMPFRVISERAVGIAVTSPADKMTYSAFEVFDPTGICVGVTYNSGRYETVGADKLSISYQQGDSLRYRDSGVIISYDDTSVLLRVTVLRADYDLSGVALPDVEAIFNGDFITADFTGTLPTGLDGIMPSTTITGGGTDVGEYTLTLTFSTASDNYNCPAPMSATLTILPCPREVVWSDISFVYDGKIKCPSAYYLDVLGRKVPLSVAGSHSYAGRYTAVVSTTDGNYALENPTVEYEILKADYDLTGVVWQGGGSTYDGGEKSVFLTGLPAGVTVIGYVNSTAVNVGEYTATATLDYDSANYNPPVVPSFKWCILPAEYPLDTFSFSDACAVYDGLGHYPILSGNMPVGLDGIALEYSFSRSATHVVEGRVRVEITFKTQSKNYIAPDLITRYVEILPQNIVVKWKNIKFYYTGAALVPTAFADECAVEVEGAAIDAGEHLATAVSLDSDYRITNDTCPFFILKAANLWLASLSVSDVFFGRSPAPYAKAQAGDVTYVYYTDQGCTNALDEMPSAVGRYYVVAHSQGDRNHEPITSSPVSFEIVAILPVALQVSLDREEYAALDRVNFTASLLNNDGSCSPLDASVVKVTYQGADVLLFGDTSVSFFYGELACTVPVKVVKRLYDMSGAKWSTDSFTFSGAAASVTLSGLPEGVTVREYIGNGFINAGEYTVYAVFNYDAENYEAPSLPAHTVTVAKQIVSIPSATLVEYDGAPHTAAITPSPLYYYGDLPTAFHAGAYPITLTLTDPDNYTFGTSDTATVYFVIMPRRISVTVSDIDWYFFNKEAAPTWEITAGTLVGGDALSPIFRIVGNSILAEFDNPDYDVTVIAGAVHMHRSLSPGTASVLLLVILCLVAITLAIIAVLKNRHRIACVYASSGRSDDSGATAVQSPPDPTPPTEPKDDIATVVDVEYADTAITNALAKDLIRHDDGIVTNGTRHGIVNVDTLSRSFSAGDRVDINALKSHSLIPYDTAYIKVLARGIIDKPLYVYANDFSLSAVKMIALSGGKAVKVNTVLRKNNKE